MKRLYGIVCASVTPFDENGKVDFESLENYVDHMAKTGIDCVYPCGTTGEAILLTPEERKAIAETVIKANRGRMPVFVQCTGATPEETMLNIKNACEAGADGVGVMTPIFYKVDDAALREYFLKTSEAAMGKPVYMYSIPSNANNDISPALFGEMIDTCDNILGIKYSAKDMVRFQEYLRAPKTRKPDVLLGADGLILSLLANGGAGEVTGPGCVFPALYRRLFDSFGKGDLESAGRWQQEINIISKSVRPVTQIPAIKAMLKKQGIIRLDVCRSPFRKITEEEHRLLDAALEAYKELESK